MSSPHNGFGAWRVYSDESGDLGIVIQDTHLSDPPTPSTIEISLSETDHVSTEVKAEPEPSSNFQASLDQLSSDQTTTPQRGVVASYLNSLTVPSVSEVEVSGTRPDSFTSSEVARLPTSATSAKQTQPTFPTSQPSTFTLSSQTPRVDIVSPSSSSLLLVNPEVSTIASDQVPHPITLSSQLASSAGLIPSTTSQLANRSESLDFSSTAASLPSGLTEPNLNKEPETSAFSSAVVHSQQNLPRSETSASPFTLIDSCHISTQPETSALPSAVVGSTSLHSIPSLRTPALPSAFAAPAYHRPTQPETPALSYAAIPPTPRRSILSSRTQALLAASRGSSYHRSTQPETSASPFAVVGSAYQRLTHRETSTFPRATEGSALRITQPESSASSSAVVGSTSHRSTQPEISTFPRATEGSALHITQPESSASSSAAVGSTSHHSTQPEISTLSSVGANSAYNPTARSETSTTVRPAVRFTQPEEPVLSSPAADSTSGHFNSRRFTSRDPTLSSRRSALPSAVGGSLQGSARPETSVLSSPAVVSTSGGPNPRRFNSRYSKLSSRTSALPSAIGGSPQRSVRPETSAFSPAVVRSPNNSTQLETSAPSSPFVGWLRSLIPSRTSASLSAVAGSFQRSIRPVTSTSSPAVIGSPNQPTQPETSSLPATVAGSSNQDIRPNQSSFFSAVVIPVASPSKPTTEAMESTSRVSRKRKAATKEIPAVKKPRIAAKASSSTNTTSAAKKTATRAQAPAARKAAKGKAKAKESPAPEKVRAKRGRKRNVQDDDDDEDGTNPPPPPKKPRVVKQPVSLKLPVINQVPTQKLDVYVFGDGTACELGLGNAKTAINVKRPRLNPNLSAKEVGVVHLACGGMHSAALTHDNRILTWGVNDLGALGRDTTWDGGLKDIDGNDSDSEDDSHLAMNPHECEPSAVSPDHFPEGTKFVQLACGDSCTFALTDTGLVYGWGTFRSNEGVFGFSIGTLIQRTPILVSKLSKITQICCGSNHAIALNQKGDVWIWGAGQQNQLGHRIVERRKYECLSPNLLRLLGKRIRLIGCGHDHSFAVDQQERVWVWGVNSFGQAGDKKTAGRDNAIIFSTKRFQALSLPNGERLVSITGGSHHSAAVTTLGRCLVWGRMDGNQIGIPAEALPAVDKILDQNNKPRILINPTEVPGLGRVRHVAIGTDHTIAINAAGEAYSWGFNINYQCGQGGTDDVEVPTRIDNTAVRGKMLEWAGAGGNFSILAGPAVD